MPALCASCDHPQVREINHRIREDRPLTDISRWLDELGTPVTRQALSRHAKSHLGVEPARGRRPASGRLLEAIVELGEDGLESGELGVTLKDAISARKALDARAARDVDRDILLKITLALTGHVPRVRIIDPEMEAVEAEYRPLLNAGV